MVDSDEGLSNDKIVKSFLLCNLDDALEFLVVANVFSTDETTSKLLRFLIKFFLNVAKARREYESVKV